MSKGLFSDRYRYQSVFFRMGAALFDFLGFLMTFPFRGKGPEIVPEKIKKILVIRADAIGDTLMTYPALTLLGTNYPQARIDFLTSPEAAPLAAQAFPDMRVLEWNDNWFSRRSGFIAKLASASAISKYIRLNEYDLAIDFRGDIRILGMLVLAKIPLRIGCGGTGGGFLLTHSKCYREFRHQVLMNIALLDFLDIRAPQDALQFGAWSGSVSSDPLLAASHPKPLIAIHPSSSSPAKEWSAENFLAIIEKIREHKTGTVVLFGTQDEKDRASPLSHLPPDVIDYRGRSNLGELPALLKACDLFIGNDSGPGHLAAIVGLPVLSIFSGTNTPAHWHPWTKRLELVYHAVPCSPCESIRCPLGHHDCMRRITVEQVWDRLQAMIKSIHRTRS